MLQHTVLPYPNGWFAIAFSHELEPGKVLSRTIAGRPLVVWRTESGKPVVQDAYCRHLGANIGVGGWVDGEEVTCPFHGWRYGTDGACTAIPYEKRVMRVSLNTWEVREGGGVLMVWFDQAGNAPSWEMPERDLEGYAVRTREWTVSSQPQEICENAADGAHFQFVHKLPTVADIEGRPDGTSMWFTVTMRPKEEETPQELPEGQPKPYDVKGSAAKNVIAVHGPGLVLHEVHAKGRIMQNHLYVTPLDHEKVVLRGMHMLRYPGGEKDAEVEIERTMGWAAFDAWEDDFPIWENKIYLPKPFATHPSEIAIVAYRKWYRQWYQEEFSDAALANG